MVNISKQMNQYSRQNAIEDLKQTLIRKGIYKKEISREIKNAVPYNRLIEDIDNLEIRSALREMRFLPGMTTEKYEAEIKKIIEQEKNDNILH